MKQSFLIISFTISSFLCLSQISKLDEKNGFQKIKLNTKLSLYPNFELSTTQTNYSFFNPFQTYVYTGNEMKSIGEIKIDKVFVEVNNEMVIKDIYVYCPYDLDLVDAIKEIYGKNTGSGSPVKQSCGATLTSYLWYGKKVDLSVFVISHKTQFDSDHCSVPDGVNLTFHSSLEDEKEFQNKKKKVKTASDGL